jgi:hypothetical protein
MNTKSLFMLSFNRSDKKKSQQTNANVGVLLSDLLKESLNKLFVFMVPELYLQALRLLMKKTAEKRLIP